MTAIKDTTTGFGLIAYNGYTFSPLRGVKVKAVPVYDEAGRKVVHIKYTLTVTAVIHGSTAGVSALATTQTRMGDLQDRLLEPGHTLFVDDIGLDEDISTYWDKKHADLIYGALPRSCSLSPIGGALAWEVVWVVEFNIKRCQGMNTSAFSAFNYETVYATNEEGLVTRTISGYFTIPNTESNGNYPVQDIEAMWRKLNFTVPICFRRLNATRRLSPNKCRIDFTITDQELSDLPYPDGIVHADVDYDWESQPPGFITWTGQLSGTMTVAPGYPPALAGQKFFIMLFSVAADLTAAAAASKGVVIPEKIRFGTKKFGRTSRFAVTFRFVGCLTEILNSSGMWKPVPGTSNASWHASMVQKNIFNLSGRGDWRQKKSDDILIDVCSGETQGRNRGNDSGVCFQPLVPYSQRISCENITKEKSWLLYENKLRGIQEQQNLLHRISQHFKGVRLQSVPVIVGDLGVPMSTGWSQQHLQDHISQYEGASDNYILMTGNAIRLKYAPEIPRLTKVGGIEVEELARNVEINPMGYFFGCTMFGARWAVLYRVKGQMSYIKPAKNKNLCFFDGEEDGR